MSDPSSPDTYISKTIGVILFLLVLFGIISNSFALHYFHRRLRSHILSRVFCAISLTDLLTSVLTLSVALCYCEGRSAHPFDQSSVREIWGSLWNISSRYSVYLVALISIARSLRIVFPLVPLKAWLLNLGLAWYLMFLVATTPALYGVTHYYKAVWCAVALNKSQFVKVHDAKYYMIIMSIPIGNIIPLPLVMISAGICLYKINKHVRKMEVSLKPVSGMPQIPRSTANDGAVKSAITIVLFALIYIVLNIPYCVIYLFVQIESARLSLPPPLVIPQTDVKRYVMGFTHVLSISLNAILNPALYYWRMSEFREHVNHMIGRNARTVASVAWTISGVLYFKNERAESQ